MALLSALSGVVNAREPFPGLATGGQPAATHFAALKDAGCNVVVDLRDPMEDQPFDPATTVRAAGLAYVNVPVAHGPNDDRTFDAVRRTLQEIARKGERTFVYCNSGNRVGGALLPYFILDRGIDEETAVTTAMQIGTRNLELVEGALDYVRRTGGRGNTVRGVP